MRRFTVALGLCVGLAACMGSQEVRTAAGNAASGPLPVRLGSDAIKPVGLSTEISFGRYREGVISAMMRLTGEAPSQVAGCPDAPRHSIVSYKSGLTLAFTDAHLSGWRVVRGAWATASGIAIGSVLDSPPQDGVVYQLKPARGVTGSAGSGSVTHMQVWRGRSWPIDQACPNP